VSSFDDLSMRATHLAARTGPYVPMAAGLALGALGFLGWLPAGPTPRIPCCCSP